MKLLKQTIETQTHKHRHTDAQIVLNPFNKAGYAQVKEMFQFDKHDAANVAADNQSIPHPKKKKKKCL